MFSTAGKGQPCAYTESGTWRCSRSLLPPREQTLGWSSITHGFREGKSQICSDFCRDRRGVCAQRGHGALCTEQGWLSSQLTQDAFLSQNHHCGSKVILHTGTSIRLGFTCCTGTCTDTEAPDPTQPCCPHQPVLTCRKANPSLLGWERAPRQGCFGHKTKQCSVPSTAPSLHFPAELKERGCITLKTRQQGPHHHKNNSLHKKESKSKRR